MSTAPRERMSVAAYLDFERASEERHEYVDGEIFAMSGASYARNVLVGNLVYELHRVLDGRPCRPLANDMRVRAGGDPLRLP